MVGMSILSSLKPLLIEGDIGAPFTLNLPLNPQSLSQNLEQYAFSPETDQKIDRILMDERALPFHREKFTHDGSLEEAFYTSAKLVLPVLSMGIIRECYESRNVRPLILSVLNSPQGKSIASKKICLVTIGNWVWIEMELIAILYKRAQVLNIVPLYLSNIQEFTPRMLNLSVMNGEPVSPIEDQDFPAKEETIPI